jgi:hypothetical protein
MTTSGTYAFSLDLSDIIEDAYERVGEEFHGGHQYRSARRSLDLLFLEWQNRGLNLWKIKQGTETMVAGTAAYALSAERLDIIEATMRTGTGTDQTDLFMERISVSNYSQIANKNTTGQPTQFWIEQAPSGITVNMWPVPDKTYTFVYYYMELIQDTGDNAANTVDVPTRFLPSLTAGLAYYLALKTPRAIQAIPVIKGAYEEQINLAMDSAREKSSLHLTPSRSYS